MAFGSFAQQEDNDLAEINMVPLIDVMLVLLVIFIVAAPMITQSVKVDLPRTSTVQSAPPAQPVALTLDAQGQVSWNGEVLPADELHTRLVAAAAQQPQPDVQLHADRATPYEALAQVMAEASGAGLHKLAFVSLPQR